MAAIGLIIAGLALALLWFDYGATLDGIDEPAVAGLGLAIAGGFLAAGMSNRYVLDASRAA